MYYKLYTVQFLILVCLKYNYLNRELLFLNEFSVFNRSRKQVCYKII